MSRRQHLARRVRIVWALRPLLCFVLLGAVLLFLVRLFAPPFVHATDRVVQWPEPQEEIARLNEHVEEAVRSAEAGDLSAAAGQFERFRKDWEEVEDEVRALSPAAYREMEEAIEKVEAAFATQPQDARRILEALEALEEANENFVAGRAGPASPTEGGETSSLTEALAHLREAEEALERNDLTAAIAAVSAFRAAWPDVEGEVRGRSREVYRATEDNMVRVHALLVSHPPDAAGARALIRTMLLELSPLIRRVSRYTALDAAIILLREGVEALLIIAALLAFLSRSGQRGRQGWIWGGSIAGLFASVLTAVAVQAVFAKALTGASREVIEGVTSLVAAVMLFSVSYWLHSKSHLGAWQKYIDGQAQRALTSGRLISLAALAFLAVYREGAETVLFYIGIAPSISARDLLLGFGLGASMLVAIAVLVLGAGLRLPLRAFFRVSSILIYYLGFKFVGTGIHALQVANLLPANTADYLPSSDLLGLYPTWQTTLPQVALLLAALVVLFYTSRVRPQPAEAIER